MITNKSNGFAQKYLETVCDLHCTVDSLTILNVLTYGSNAICRQYYCLKIINFLKNGIGMHYFRALKDKRAYNLRSFFCVVF